MKKGSSGDQDAPSGGKRRALQVLRNDGVRERFLRGVITNDLVRRGVEFDDAYAIARAVRDQFSDKQEVSTSEIRACVDAQLEQILDPERAAEIREAIRAPSSIRVVTGEHPQPFSLGLLARSVSAAGVDLERAYGLAALLEQDLRETNELLPTNDAIADRMATLIESAVGEDAAHRYRLVRYIQQLPHPLIIFIGGASGTGKSTLAMELAPLLRVYRVIATDTIRQVMRMVFTPAILPSIHSSSFDGLAPGDAPDVTLGATREPSATPRLVSGYEEQSARVCVGVRAVVERAIAENMSIIVEGVHLLPGLVPFKDLEGAAYQVPLMLSTLDEEVHRLRFLARARHSPRGADRYVRGLTEIRTVHDHLLDLAEAHDVPLLDTSEGDPDAGRLMRVITGVIDTRFPEWRQAVRREPDHKIPTLLLCIDGLPDRPAKALGGRTPLQAASTRTLDRLAREGQCGQGIAVAPGVVPDTASGTLSLLGQSALALKRGPIEALGAGLELAPGELALRGNFATLDDKGKIVDRRAGRIRKGAARLASALDRLPLPGISPDEVEVRVAPSTEHRFALVFKGEALSSNIRGSDPGDGVLGEPPLEPEALDADDEDARRAAQLLALFEKEARKILADHPVNKARIEQALPPANAIITRGPGHVHRLVDIKSGVDPLRVACISADKTVRGICGLLGADIIPVAGITANLDTRLGAKIKAATNALAEHDLVVLHVKGADIAAHDCRPELKAEFLEKLDAQLRKLIRRHAGPLRIIVASDHATLSESGQHSADPIPVVIWGKGIEPDDVQVFDEFSVAQGSLGTFPMQTLLGKCFSLSS